MNRWMNKWIPDFLSALWFDGQTPFLLPSRMMRSSKATLPYQPTTQFLDTVHLCCFLALEVLGCDAPDCFLDALSADWNSLQESEKGSEIDVDWHQLENWRLQHLLWNNLLKDMTSGNSCHEVRFAAPTFAQSWLDVGTRFEVPQVHLSTFVLKQSCPFVLSI